MADKNVQVGIIMGSDSDLNIMKKAQDSLASFGIDSEMFVMSAHRTPDDASEYAKSARSKGIKVIIAGAGGAAHLPGVLAAYTTLPVIGVPIAQDSATIGGIDALLAIVQMPSGIPVATVAINGAYNAGILAAQIIGVSDTDMQKKIEDKKVEMAEAVRNKNKSLNQ